MLDIGSEGAQRRPAVSIHGVQPKERSAAAGSQCPGPGSGRQSKRRIPHSNYSACQPGPGYRCYPASYKYTMTDRTSQQT